MSTKDLILGIDPGLSGAVALLDGDNVVLLEDTPVVKFSEARIKQRVDGTLLAELLRPYADRIKLAVVEKVGARPGEAASGAFSFGYTSGCIAGVLGAMQVPIVTPSPAAWKRALHLGSDKDLSRSRAIELFPTLASRLNRKKDHDRAEAVLLAVWGQRQ